jgi:hypothetical protein
MNLNYKGTVERFQTSAAKWMETVYFCIYCAKNSNFNRQCLVKKLIPKYYNIKVPNTSPAAYYTSKKVRNIRIKDEIKFLYKKKQQLNKDLYHTHLEVAKKWGNLWTLIAESIDE